MAMNKKVIELIRTLKQATSRGRLQWNSADTEESVSLKTGQATVTIEQEHPDASQSDYCVTIKDLSGRTIEVEFFDSRDADSYADISDLFNTARRSALRVDEIIEKLITEVSEKAS